MKRMQRRAALAAAMLLGAGSLAGCASASAAPQTGETKDGKVQVTFWYSGGKTAAGVVQEIMNQFNTSQNTYTISGIQLADYDETYTKLQAGIAGKNAPDLVLLDADKAQSLSDKGLLTELDSCISADSEFQKDDYTEVFYKQGVTAAGKTFAIPAYGTTQVMYYNIGIFEKAGIDPSTIHTWQDLAAAAEKMTVKENGQTTVYGWEPMWNEDNLIDIAFSNGAKLLSEDGKAVLINSDEWVEAWEAIRAWIHDDQIMRIHSGGQGWEYWYATMDDVLQDRSAGYTGSSGDQADLDFTKVAAMEQPGFGGQPSAPVARALQMVVPAGKSEQTVQGAYEFMKYFSSPEIQAKWSMATGYVPVRKSTVENADYKKYTDENPQALVPFNQSLHGSVLPIDPTGGKIYDALSIAADKVEIENVPAKEALDEACKTAQKALDEAVSKQ